MYLWSLYILYQYMDYFSLSNECMEVSFSFFLEKMKTQISKWLNDLPKVTQQTDRRSNLEKEVILEITKLKDQQMFSINWKFVTTLDIVLGTVIWSVIQLLGLLRSDHLNPYVLVL